MTAGPELATAVSALVFKAAEECECHGVWNLFKTLLQ
jgi:hypothetical protein